MEKSFWNNNHELSGLYEEVSKKIPMMGECEKGNPKLEKLRKAVNLYYEVMNNGGMNTMYGFKRIFGYSTSDVRHILKIQSWVGNTLMYKNLMIKMNEVIASLVIEAAQEQLQK